MNRRIAFLFVLCVVLAAGVFGQSDTSLLNTKAYASYFGFTGRKINIKSDYIWAAADNDILKYGGLNIDTATARQDDERILPDTPVEFALLSYYSPAVIQHRPVQASTALPENNPQLAAKKLGAALYQDIVVLRFLGDTASVGRYEGMLKFICDENGVTRTEVENYFRAGIRGLVSEIVNEEFNKISFPLRNLSANRTYNTALTRNPQNGHYVLSYERPEIQNSRKTISGQTLETLLSALSKNRDFTQADIAAVREQSQRIPAVVYAEWRAKGVARGADAMKILVDTLTNFFLNPNRANYEAVRGIYARYRVLKTIGDPLADAALGSYQVTLSSLCDSLYNRVGTDTHPNTILTVAKIPDDPLYNVFATRYGAER